MFAVIRAARRFESLSKQALLPDDLSFLEGLVLAALFFESPTPVKPSQLAQSFDTTRGNISHCVSSLEAKGLLQRKIDANDARVYLLTLKPQGRRCALRVISAFDKLQKDFETEIGRSGLLNLLKDLRKLEAMHGPKESASAANR